MKKLIFFLFLIVFFGLGFLIAKQFEMPSVIIFDQKELNTIQIPTEVDFCGEAVPLDIFYVREAWEKDFLVLLGTEYQSLLYLKRAGKYMPFIEQELKKRGLPQDLKYIAVAESAFQNTAQSHAGALGIWQFMPGTARQYGLIVDNEIDERLHFEKATQAALDYLKFLYEKMENWTLVAAAYNAGYNRIIGHLVDQKVITYYDLYMNAETSRYLFRILAIKEIMEHPKKYGVAINEADLFQWPGFRRIQTSGIENLADWSLENRTTLKAVKELNPWILKDYVPLGDWTIKVPSS